MTNFQEKQYWQAYEILLRHKVHFEKAFSIMQPMQLIYLFLAYPSNFSMKFSCNLSTAQVQSHYH